MKNNKAVLNVFQKVVPKGAATAKAKLPAGRAVGSFVGSVRVLDRNGRFNAPLAPRTYGEPLIAKRSFYA